MPEAMTREERFLTAIKPGKPDRIPFSAMLDDFALRQKKISPLDRLNPANYPKIIQAYHETFEELGGYDFQVHAGIGFPFGDWRGSLDVRVNSVPSGQEGIVSAEKETLTFADYDRIINLGWNDFCREFYPRISGLSLEELDQRQKKLLAIYLEDLEWWKKRGVPVYLGGFSLPPEVILSLGRTLTAFTLDMHRYPDKVQAVMEAMVDDIVQNAIRNARAVGIPWVHIMLTRGSATFYNLKIFERFVFPFLKKMVDSYHAAGLKVNLHCDTNWLKNLPYFKEFPRGCGLVELDGTTDMIKAHEILKGHLCLKGDVPAPLLSLGQPEEVRDYCYRLIEAVGTEGGFILSAGCSVPVDAKPENVRAMINSAREYPLPTG